jgi:Ulp1 family protease
MTILPKRGHLFTPLFFNTKITDFGHLTESGTYKFENVVTWSRKGHKGDIFSLDKLFVPINQDKRNWLVVVVFFDQKRIQVFDSLYVANAGGKESKDVFRYIQDEHRRKHGTELPQKEEWVILTSKETTPRQTNSELLKKCIHSIDASASHTYMILVLQHGTAACS